MEDCEIQLNETVSHSSASYLCNDMGKLILEELRCFRKEMKEEVHKLNMNVQNFLFSKADVVNALLGSSSLFNEMDHTLSSIICEKQKFANQPQQAQIQLPLKPETQQPLIKFEPTTVELSKPQPTLAPHLPAAKAKEPGVEASAVSTSESSSKHSVVDKDILTCAYEKASKILPGRNLTSRQFVKTPSVTSEMQIARYNGNAANMHSSSKGQSYEMRKKRIKLGSSSLLFSQAVLPTSKSIITKPRSPVVSHAGRQNVSFSKTPLNPFHDSDKATNLLAAIKRLPSYRCKFCDKYFSGANDLKRHIRLHTGDRPFKCQECPKAYTRNDHLKRHMRQKHKTVIIDVDSNAFVSGDHSSISSATSFNKSQEDHNTDVSTDIADHNTDVSTDLVDHNTGVSTDLVDHNTDVSSEILDESTGLLTKEKTDDGEAISPASCHTDEPMLQEKNE